MSYVGKTPREATEEDFREKRRDMLMDDLLYAVLIGALLALAGFAMGGWVGAVGIGIGGALLMYAVLYCDSSERMRRWKGMR